MQARRKTLAVVIALSLATLGLIHAGPALANHTDTETRNVQPPFPDQTLTLAPPPAAAVSWTGDSATAAHQTYTSSSGEPCGKQPHNYCDITLLNVNVEPSFWDTRGGGVTIHVGDYTVEASDFDLYVYESNANGRLGDFVDLSGEPPGSEEELTIDEASGYYLIQVVYFATVQSSYEGTAAFDFFNQATIPPDVDNPRGLQESLASDPSTGWRSRSEMHVAMNPLDPNMLIAGSKFYNKDLQDSLGEYEFKVGTYISFDGGDTWTDLGQTAVCAAEDSTPEMWLEGSHTCYPEDDPNRGGLDPADNPDNTKPCGTERGDYGEEYITSDPWVQFDDEGNAYLMVLDHPPLGCNPEGNGWGMTLHRWDSVSPADLGAGGDTWGPRLPINFYTDELLAENVLDDKNTFTVNNAGPDGDGATGTIVACWGQTIAPLIKQQVICKRSMDQGETWTPPEDIPISQPVSDVEQLVIGVDVRASKVSPTTFYATWNHYTPSVAGEPETLEFAISEDGGLTWVHRQVPITTFRGIPRQFPHQSFRNLSIPIMAVGPEDELYITYAEYLPATAPENDVDGMEADIRLVKSTNGGITWTAPATVNAQEEDPNPNADQFQPVVEVTDSGQVNIAYFDRRLDPLVRNGEEIVHEGNYFTDVFLARSNDAGATFAESRITHDATDPEFNAPVSPSGLFFGDYQGLVATDCVAVPFFNDTHLANDEFIDPGPVRDPAFDDGLPSSPYQEAVSWQVPNTAAFGGPGEQLPEGCADVDPPPPVKCPGRENASGNHIVGTPGDDTRSGTPGRDVMCGRGGNDTLVGMRGNDLILGGTGDDTLVGGDGRDEIRGEDGSDVMRGNRGRDRMIDVLGANTFKGGGGSDQMQGGSSSDRFVSGPGQDEVRARAGRDFAAGGDGDDALRGGAGQDDLRGYRGDDTLRGGRGDDTLKGGRGSDLLSGQRGTDVCRGGPGADAFRGCEQRVQ